MSVNSYFLGGNTAQGFFSCYDAFCRDDEDFLYILKGGPGSGKSSFMRRIGQAAEAAGLDTEYVLCSGDPDSLDGIYIPRLHLGYMDGTAPHYADPLHPGISGAWVDLGRYCCTDALFRKKEEILRTGKLYREHYQRAYSLLASLGSDASSEPRNGPCRFRSAITCRGIVDAPSDTEVILTDPQKLNELREADRPWQYILHPLWPNRIIGLEENGVQYLVKAELPVPEAAIAELRRAKEIHDELEAFYNPYTDFSGVYEEAEKHIQKYL